MELHLDPMVLTPAWAVLESSDRWRFILSLLWVLTGASLELKVGLHPLAGTLVSWFGMSAQSCVLKLLVQCLQSNVLHHSGTMEMAFRGADNERNGVYDD
jgi:hypothetical protein